MYIYIHIPDNCTKAKTNQVVAPDCQTIIVTAKQAKTEHTQAKSSPDKA